MIQCRDCEYFATTSDGTVLLHCDPFSTIKETECLHKWQVLRLDAMTRAYQATVDIYRRLAPLQEKMMRQMEREIDDVEQADRWKLGLDDNDDDDDD